MDIGIISTRYAKALFAFAKERNAEDRVYEEMCCLSEVLIENPEIRAYFDDPMLSSNERMRLLMIAAGNKDVSKTTSEFINFIVKKRKENYMLFIAISYQNLYRKSRNIISAKISSVKKLDAEYINKIKTLIRNEFKLKEDSDIQLEEETDDDLIGGFVLHVEDQKFDASVLGELNEMKKKLGVLDYKVLIKD